MNGGLKSNKYFNKGAMPAIQAQIIINYFQEPHPIKNEEKPPHWFASALIEGVERHLYLGTKFRRVVLSEFTNFSKFSKKNVPLSKDLDIGKNNFGKIDNFDQNITGTVAAGKKQNFGNIIVRKCSSSNEDKNYIKSSFANANNHNRFEKIYTNYNTNEKFFSRKIKKNNEKCESNSKDSIRKIELPSEREFFKDLRQFKTVRFKDVRNRYRQLIKKYHPDQYGEYQDKVEEWMKVINIVHDSHVRRMERLGLH